jgi:hypothetical protein
LVNDNNTKPVVTHTPPAGPVRGDSVTLSVDVQAKARISAVRVYYKQMPAYHDWLMLEMQPLGDNRFSAHVPLTPEGILYYFEASDEDGNATHFPDFLKQTPYFVVPGWNPSE